MTTWDLFPFFNELDVLEIRLATLEDVVDVHVIAESKRTYSGKPKILNFDAYRHRFRKWRDKIEYVVVEDAPAGEDSILPAKDFEAIDNARWARENHQRDALWRGCGKLADDDLVHISDADEVPDPIGFQACARLEHGRILRPVLPLFVGYLDMRWEHPVPVISRYMTGKTLRDLGGPQAARLETGEITAGEGWGWHFSYMGGPAMVSYKIVSAAHAELDKPEFTDEELIAERIRTGTDLFGRIDKIAHRVALSALPAYVGENHDRFKDFLCPF